MANSYAIVETGGKQYRAEKGDDLLVERLPADEGGKVNLRAVMFRATRTWSSTAASSRRSRSRPS